MTGTEILQNIWAGLATAAAVVLLGLYLNMRRKWLISWKRESRLLIKQADMATEINQATKELLALDEEYQELRKDHERKLDLIVELEHELDRTKPLKRA